MDKFSRDDPPSQTVFPIARAGYPFIFGAAFTTLVLAILGLTSLTLLALVLTLSLCGFFRDPDRLIADKEGGIVSPADGKVISVGKVASGYYGDGECLKVSIFMSVFNVHVNRIPFTGRVKEITYYPGKFLAANLEKASLQNEHNAVLIETEDGQQICVVQVAGLIARRIICQINPGDHVLRGQRFGLICMGSRLDVYLPREVKLKVAVGDKVMAGTSLLGHFAS
jgi:phosphatidylserine decarboxylase